MTTNRLLTSTIILSFCLTFFGPAARAQVCSPLPSGIVAWYKGDGNANDSSGNGFHGDLSSAGVASGHVGQAFNFTAQDQSVVIPNNPSLFPLTALTIEGWINPLDYSGCSGAYRIFHTVQFEPLRGYVTFINCPTQKLIGQVFDASGNENHIISNASIPASSFTHFATTWDGTNLSLYINGVLDDTVATTISAIGTNTAQLRIGNATALGFRGLIDEISLYNRAVSGAEVSAVFNAGTAGKCLGPSAAGVAVSGRVMTASGRGIAKVSVSLTDVEGVRRTALTSTFGYYRFYDVPAGESYLLSVRAKTYQFKESTRVIQVMDDLAEEDFTATP